MIQDLEQLLAESKAAGRGLIPTLQAVQKLEGCLSEDVIDKVSQVLGRPPGEVSEVVDFYAFLQRQPRGQKRIKVCMATSCHHQGSAAVLERLRKELGINVGEATTDGKFSLEIKFCLGACGQGPNLEIGDEPYNGVLPDDIPRILAGEVEKIK